MNERDPSFLPAPPLESRDESTFRQGMRVLGREGYKIKNVFWELYSYKEYESKNAYRKEMSLFFIPFKIKSNMALSPYTAELVENLSQSLTGLPPRILQSWQDFRKP